LTDELLNNFFSFLKLCPLSWGLYYSTGDALQYSNTEPEFLNILKCNSAESVSAGLQFNFLNIFYNKINMYRYFDPIFNFAKFTQKRIILSASKNCSLYEPLNVYEFGLWLGSGLPAARFLPALRISSCLGVGAGSGNGTQACQFTG
jgi:hypothetical protein